ncbi:adenylate/guanylate cyclase domain-containing protein [Bradyrhizobium erythrophlei]|nr:adenylate/guanylate cyclase domain-containing protein [Bradyrhizobium erythrophlei]
MIKFAHASGVPMLRRLAVILAADVVGFSALMEENEEGTVARVTQLRTEVIEPSLHEEHGRLIKTTGDGFLAEFASPMAALRSAITIQEEVSRLTLPLQLRIGLNLGDVIIQDDGDVYGEGVNIAARLEGLCEPGVILVSEKLYSEVVRKIDVRFEDRGELKLKNIGKPIRAYSVGKGLQSSGPVVVTLEATPSIAVLPFNNMSSDPEQDFFADGITEDIITELSRFKGLLVIARNSTFTYKGKPVDIKKIGAELGVKYVLEGSVRRAGQRVRINAQLINVETGGHIWAERYDGDLVGIFDLQDDITKRVVATLQTELIFLEGSLIDRTASAGLDIWTANKKAWREFYGLNRDSLEKSRDLARQMTVDFPASPEGYKLLSLVTSHIIFMGFASNAEELKSEAEQAIRTALKLSVNDEHVYWGLGIVFGTLNDRVDEAIGALQRSIEINPNFSLGYGTLGTILAYGGRAQESIETTKFAIKLNPKDPSIFFRYTVLSISHFLLADYSEAAKWARSSIERKPDYWVAHALLTASLQIVGKTSEAATACCALLAALPRLSITSMPIQPVRPKAAQKLFHHALTEAGLPSSS